MPDSVPAAKKPSADYPRRKTMVLLERTEAVCIFLCLLWSVSCTIFSLSLYMDSHGLNKVENWLCAAGVLVCVIDLVFVGKRRMSPGFPLLMGICASAGVSSFLMRRYGVSKNVSSLAWMVILIVLFYSAPFRMERRRLKKLAGLLYGTFLLVWSVLCSLSFVQYALQIGADGPNHSSSPWLRGLGFYRHRLYGLFGYPQFGGAAGAMILLIGGYYFASSKNLLIRALTLLLNIPVFFYIILSGSRNSAGALYFCVFAGSCLLFRNAFHANNHAKEGKKQSPSGHDQAAGHFSGSARIGKTLTERALPILLAMGVLLAFHLLFSGTKNALEYVPGFFSGQSESESASAGPSALKASPAYLAALRTSPSGPAALTASGKTGRITASAGDSKDSGTTKDSGTSKKSENLLRKGKIKSDISTGRFRIWEDYLSLYKEIGLFGLSPENSSFYIQETAPKLYIVSRIKKKYPELYAEGYVFHPHSAYLRVFVAAGFLGAGFLLLFMVLCGGAVCSYILRSPLLSMEFIFSLLVVGAGGFLALFDNEVFFNMHPDTFIFWMALGILLRCAFLRNPAEPHGNVKSFVKRVR